jgi:predicted O-methyltransferase YrrM
MKPSIITNQLKHLKLESMKRDIPNISEENAYFLQSLIREQKPHHILEIGTANGYSTLHFANAFSREENHTYDITTIESAWNAHNEAVEHFKNCKVKNVHALWGDAKAVIPSLRDGYFDFCFIDGMKREYLDYLLLVIPKLTLDAMVILDDVEKFRSKMENLYTWLEDRNLPYHLEKTDPDDSIMILYGKDL